MSRVANKPIQIPSGVEIKSEGRHLYVKGPKGELSVDIHESVSYKHEGEKITFEAAGKDSMAGTMRSLVSNVVIGVEQGFEKKLELVGVGYRAKVQGKTLNLTLGFSHPINYAIPEGMTIETPSQTEIIIKGIDKQKVGQIAADIRSLRPPEPYKGKGVKYADEHIIRKEAKKK